MTRANRCRSKSPGPKKSTDPKTSQGDNLKKKSNLYMKNMWEESSKVCSSFVDEFKHLLPSDQKPEIHISWKYLLIVSLVLCFAWAAFVQQMSTSICRMKANNEITISTTLAELKDCVPDEIVHKRTLNETTIEVLHYKEELCYDKNWECSFTKKGFINTIIYASTTMSIKDIIMSVIVVGLAVFKFHETIPIVVFKNNTSVLFWIDNKQYYGLMILWTYFTFTNGIISLLGFSCALTLMCLYLVLKFNTSNILQKEDFWIYFLAGVRQRRVLLVQNQNKILLVTDKKGNINPQYTVIVFYSMLLTASFVFSLLMLIGVYLPIAIVAVVLTIL